MQIYLPIAEISVNMFAILAMGGAVGFLSGMFGVGGGFLMTPLLIFTGIPPAVAVATGANQIVASSVSGAMGQWRRGNVDIKLGTVLLIGGIIGAVAGVQLVKWLRAMGQIDLFISLAYVTFLGVIGGLMLIESLNAIRRTKSGKSHRRSSSRHNFVHGLPFKMRFHRSKLYISALPPLVLGLIVGLLVALMGVGGGFIVVPAMIYLLRVPTNVVVGTSLFQIVFVTSIVTILHATSNQTVDVVLALMLMLGGVIGAQFGVRAGQYLRGEQMRALLGFMVLAVCLRMAFDLIIRPDELYSLAPVLGGGS
ncbi:MAG: UPF0721 transmembrane protein [Rhodomicrobium sp.]|nr:MAG: UPF0721 transmembrane protein [Rhodomicrobium sp.]